MLIVAGTIAFILVMMLCTVAPKNCVVVGLVVARSLCDYGVVFQSRPAALGAISAGVVLIAIYTVLMQGISGSAVLTFVRVLYLPIFAILFWSAIAYAQFGLRSSLYNESLRMLSLVAIFCLAASTIQTKKSVKRLVLEMGMPAVLVSLTAAAGLIAYGSIGLGRLTGTFSHPNAAGAFFGLLTTLLVVFWLNDRSRVLAAALMLSALALVLTGSLGSIAGALVAIGVGIVVVTGVSRQTKLSVMVVFVAFIAVAYSKLGLSERLQEFDLGGRISTVGQSPDSLQWRLENWRRLLEVWADSPVFGNGLGSTSAIITPLGGPPHSLYLQVLVEFGLVGSALLLAMVLFVLNSSLKLVRAGFWQGSASIAILAFILVNGLVSNTIGYAAMTCLLAACGGYIYSSVERANKATPSNDSGQSVSIREFELGAIK